ncbi:MAG: aminoacetone oxidase family FAD-binding enzyme [Candidatus Krumholzibacteriia bacterium]
METWDVVVAGAGAAGVFGALRCLELAPSARVLVLEKGPRPLTKVGISGGGRCNVTHACFDPRLLVASYPRGGRELLGPFTRFGPAEMVAWLAARGVAVKAESDGRMFPISDRSDTVVETFLAAARRLGATLRTRVALTTVRPEPPGGFRLAIGGGSELQCRRLLLATGGDRRPAAYSVPAALGHTIAPPVPSLFTFKIPDPRLRGLAGVAVEKAVVAVAGTSLRQRGPVLVTHWGLSGPAVLALSSRGARDLHAARYRFDLQVSWVPALGTGPGRTETAGELLRGTAAAHGRRRVHAHVPVDLPRRLWSALVAGAGVPGDRVYADLTRDERRALAAELTAGSYAVTGVSTHKEEFVTCGGVVLKEVDFRSMESRVQPGLHLAGEVLDIDALTGGYNLQAAWTTGWIAGEAMARAI